MIIVCGSQIVPLLLLWLSPLHFVSLPSSAAPWETASQVDLLICSKTIHSIRFIEGNPFRPAFSLDKVDKVKVWKLVQLGAGLEKPWKNIVKDFHRLLIISPALLTLLFEDDARVKLPPFFLTIGSFGVERTLNFGRWVEEERYYQTWKLSFAVRS